MAPQRPTAAETNLYSEGAEFLVLGHLLIRGVHATKAYTRFPGWDVLATHPTTGRSCRIQVKARLATDFDGGFPIKNLDAEFVVLAALNRGNRYRSIRSDDPTGGEREPSFWVLPMPLVAQAATTAAKWGTSSKVFLRQLVDASQYLGAWHLIQQHLTSNND
jgi:hypothetical protein